MLLVDEGDCKMDDWARFSFQKETLFSMTLICACEVNGSIFGPGLIRHRSVQPFFQCVSHV